MKEVMSVRIDSKKKEALNQIHNATKIPITELVNQGVDRVIETYQMYIPDAEFKNHLGIILDDSEEYLKRLADDD